MLALIILWIVVYLSGLLFCKIGGEKEASQLWIHLTGFFFLFFSQGVIFFGAQLLGWSFTRAIHCLEVVYGAVTIGAVCLCTKELKMIWEKIKNRKAESRGYRRYFCLIIFLFIGLLWMISLQMGENREDAVVEIAATTILTDTMNQYHPFTHQPFSLGVIMSRKIITLPFWYGALSHWTGLEAVMTVQVLGSGVSLLFALLAFAELGNLLFERNLHYTCWLVILMEFLYLSGDYFLGNESYRQLHRGYSGEAITVSIIMPCVIIVLYRLLGKYLRENFKKEILGISMGNGLIRISLLLIISLFLTTVQWGIFVLLLAIFLFALMSLMIMAMKKAGKAKEENLWHR